MIVNIEIKSKMGGCIVSQLQIAADFCFIEDYSNFGNDFRQRIKFFGNGNCELIEVRDDHKAVILNKNE